jgi:DnaJ-class molecular chaperone
MAEFSKVTRKVRCKDCDGNGKNVYVDGWCGKMSEPCDNCKGEGWVPVEQVELVESDRNADIDAVIDIVRKE